MAVQSLTKFKVAWIEVFHAVLEHKSETGAATSLGCNQSTISRSIKELSSFLGSDVFEKGAIPNMTRAGHLFLIKSFYILELVTECQDMDVNLVQDKVASGRKREHEARKKRLGIVAKLIR